MFPGPRGSFQVLGKFLNNPDISFQGFNEMRVVEYIWKYTVHMPNKEDNNWKGYKLHLLEPSDAEIEYTQKYLESCQNERLSNWGMTKVAFIICATATMSDIYSKKDWLLKY